MNGHPLLEVKGLVKHYTLPGGLITNRQSLVAKAVDGVSFEIPKGSTLGLVGESGCGKSTTARCVLRLAEPTGGQIFFEGEDIVSFDAERLRRWRREAQIIFQDPYASLDPRIKAFDIIAEPLHVNGMYAKSGGRDYVMSLLENVGLRPEHGKRYPHEFSGGQRQRVAIARALALRPKLIVCDEPVSALDVSIRSQIVNLLKDLQKQFDLTYLFIAHDLSLVRLVCDYVAVMYLGKIVELADRISIFEKPQHPYTQALLSAVPLPDPRKQSSRSRIPLQGDVPSPINPPSGCPFHPRCFKARPVCSDTVPPLASVAIDHKSACLFSETVEVV